MKRLLILAAIAASFVLGQSATPVTYPAGNNGTPGPGATWFVMEPQAVPTSPTVILSGNVVILGGWISCGATARTITITDGNSINFMTSVTVNANSVSGLSIFAGAYFPTSFSISASGSGCFYSIWGRR